MARTIRMGNTGDDVRELQTTLAHTGYLPANTIPSGVFDTVTTRAVLAFQKDHGLAEDGLVGPNTWAELAKLSPADVPDWGTAGPAPDAHPSVFSTNGYWSGAKRVDAAPGRMGPAIKPRTVVVHTTDTLRGTLGAIVRSWSSPGSAGACAHFIIGATLEDGVIQMISIYRNGNHAGGKIHGNWKLPDGTLVHPNTWSVGIEIEAGGRLGKKTKDGKWIHPDTGREVAPEDVFVDRSGVGWQKVTAYQFEQLARLLDALKAELGEVPVGTSVAPDGDYKENGVAPWAAVERGLPTVVGHVTLDPVNKTDPGPEVMSWLVENRYIAA